MTLLDRLAGLLGYTKAHTMTQAPAWLSAQAMAEQFNLPELTLPEAQLELYQRLSWVQIAVSLTAQTAAIADFHVHQLEGEKTEEIENHPFELLLHKPNPLYSRSEFLEATYSYRAMTGNAYWWLNKANENAAPDEMWVLPSEKIKPVPDNRMFIRGYMFDPGGTEQPILLETHEVVHFRKWHPRNPFVGLSPVEALATVATGDMSMQKYNTNLFHKDNAKAPGALAWADPIDDETWQEMKADIKEQHGGTKRSLMMLRNVGKGGVQWVSMAMSQKDMEFLAGRQFNKEEIFATFAPGLSSVLDVNATEANAVAGKGTFIEFAVWPLLVSMAEKITNDVLPYYGPKLVGDFDDIRPSDRQMDLNEQVASERVMTVDELRGKYYQLEPIGDNRGRLLVAEIGKTLLGGVEETAEGEQSPQQDLMVLDAKLKTATVAINAGVEPKKAFQVVGLPPEWVENPEPQPAQLTQVPPRGQLTGPTQQEQEQEALTKAALKSQSTKAHTSAMVAFFMPPAVVAQIANMQRLLPISSSPVPAGELHITMLILGDALEMADMQPTIELALNVLSQRLPPLRGRINGVGRFQGVEPNVDALYLSFDAKELPDWRAALVEALREHGIESPSDHGFTPHITLGYVPADTVTPMLSVPTGDFSLDTLSLAWGDERKSWRLLGDSPDATEEQRQLERKALKKWLKKRPYAQPSDFHADYLTDDEVKAIFAEQEGGAGQDFFPGKATRKLPGADGNDQERAELERKHTDKLALAFRKLLRLVVPPGTTPENITPDIAVARYHENSKLVRDAIVEMLLDAANLGAETGIAQVETLLGVRKQVGITGTNWDMVNENVLRWVLGSGGGFGEGYGDHLTGLLARTSERQIRTQVAEWIQNGLTQEVLIRNLGRQTFGMRRAETVVLTEVTRVYAEGNVAAWRESRVIEKKRWNTVNDEIVHECPICWPLHGQEVGIDEPFRHPDGTEYEGPPGHQKCRCWITPVVGEQ